MANAPRATNRSTSIDDVTVLQSRPVSGAVTIALPVFTGTGLEAAEVGLTTGDFTGADGEAAFAALITLVASVALALTGVSLTSAEGTCTDAGAVRGFLTVGLRGVFFAGAFRGADWLPVAMPVLALTGADCLMFETLLPGAF
ncbi:hypothetical protein [Actinocorallia longicatena]|uniref:hypothetical protein n=1 Tax=Actinocorallia longicatena TaxID=111803 RepID=UPI0031D7B204